MLWLVIALAASAAGLAVPKFDGSHVRTLVPKDQTNVGDSIPDVLVVAAVDDHRSRRDESVVQSGACLLYTSPSPRD